MAKILIVDDDAAFRGGLTETLSDLGHETLEMDAGEKLLALLETPTSQSVTPDLIFLDLRMRGLDGLEALRELRLHPDWSGLPVIMLTAFADSDNTIEAMKLGAVDHLTKPIGREQVRAALERALARPGKKCAQNSPNEQPSADDRLIGSSPAMREVHKLIGLAALSDANVLVQGETGTGKEEVAQAIHRHGECARRPFVAVNCAAIPAQLLESELFGHVRGAFTGALTARAGKFKEADGGSIFLDEIGDMALTMQGKILRVLQERRIAPVGAGTSQPVNVRVLAATHRDLIAMVKEGTFRKDLFYRLNVVRINLPPLRERGADILLLAEHFLRQLAPESTTPKVLSPRASEALLVHPWPGNVRELRNVIQQAIVTVRSSAIARRDLALEEVDGSEDSLDALLALPFTEAIRRLEKLLLERALRAAAGNRAEAARQLGIHRQLLYAKIKEHALDDKESADS